LSELYWQLIKVSGARGVRIAACLCISSKSHEPNISTAASLSVYLAATAEGPTFQGSIDMLLQKLWYSNAPVSLGLVRAIRQEV
jgi:hypothetical protein